MDRGDYIASGPSQRGAARNSQREKALPPHQLSKTGLGRRLDQIMNEGDPSRQTASVSDSSASTAPADVRVSPGLGSLLEGTKTSERTVQAMGDPVRTEDRIEFARPVLVWSLVCADLLLLLQSALLISRKAPGATFTEWALVVLCVGLGAWLASLAVLLDRHKGR